MNLKSLFQPIQDIDIVPEIGGLKIYDYLYIHNQEFPDLDKAKIVMFSVGEDKDGFYNTIRKELFELYCGYSKQKVVDLGNLGAGVNFDDTQSRIKDVCETFYQKGIIPIILGSNHAHSLGQFYGYENSEKEISIVNIDSKIDLKESDNKEESHTKTMLLHQPNYIFNFIQLAYQSYLNPPEYQETLEQLSFDHVRLGKVVENIKDMEPYFRTADMVSFDLNAIKSSEIGGSNTFPFGVSTEQACQMAWYAGLSSTCSSFGIYFNSSLSTSLSAKLVAVMVWYFIEGYADRENDANFESDSYRKYIVNQDDIDDLVFYKNKLKSQWWISLPIKKQKIIVPCTYKDYVLAVEGEIPSVYIKGIEKHY